MDDVEEFHAKLEQLGSDRTKGTIIASGCFQKSALTLARVRGIGVARLIPRDKIDWVFHTRERGHVSGAPKQAIETMLINEELRTEGQRLFVVSPDGAVHAYNALGAYAVGQIRSWIDSRTSSDGSPLP